MIPFMAIGQMATSKTGRVLMVAIRAHDLRRWEVFDVGNSFGGVWYIRTRSESHSWPSSEKGWTGRIKGNVRPVHHNLRIPATVSHDLQLFRKANYPVILSTTLSTTSSLGADIAKVRRSAVHAETNPLRHGA